MNLNSVERRLEKSIAQLRAEQGESVMAKLEVSVLIGGESKQFLAELTSIVDRLESLAGTLKSKNNATEDEAPEVDTDEDEEEETSTISAAALKKGKGKTKTAGKKAAAAPAEDEEEFDLGSGETEEDESPAVTKKDLIAACRDNREAAIKVLKKLKVASIHDLKPAQYSKVLAEIGA